MNTEQRRRKLKKDIRSAEAMRDQFVTEKEELDEYIEQKEEKLESL